MESNFIPTKDKIYKGKSVDDFKELINYCTNEYKNKIAFSYKIDPDSKQPKYVNITFEQYKKDIEALGTSLLHLGLENKKVAIIAPNRYYWVVSYMAVATSNIVGVPLDMALPQVEIESLILRSNVDAVIYDKKYISIFNKIKENDNSNLKYYICMDYEQDKEYVLSYNKLVEHGSELIKNGDSSYSNIKINKDKMALMLFTSGTTSTSKAVMLSQYNICSNISAMSCLIAPRENDSVLSFLPLHHTLECTATYLFCYFSGFRICFCDGLKHISKNMLEYNISGLVCVPAVLDLMYKRIMKNIKSSGKLIVFRVMSVLSNLLLKFGIDIRRKAFKSIINGLGGHLRIIIYGSASSSKEIIKFFNTIGISMLQGYGLTETSPVICCENDKYQRIGSTGFPLHNQQVKIIDPDEKGIGEIIVKGPNVMLGYYRNEEATMEVLKNGWLYTGDLGYFDKDGYLYVTGRKKDVIVLKNGKNIYPQELETLLNKSETIIESFVYGKPTNNNDLMICAKIVYDPSNIILKDKPEQEKYNIIYEEIKNINKQMPGYKYIREIKITTEPLIKTTTQKIKRHEEMKKINM